jgi:cytochrome c556
MKRMAMIVAAAAVVALGAWAVCPAGAADKPHDIKEIMNKLNKPGAIGPNLGKDLKEDDLDWDEIQRETKEYAQYAEDLGKNDPPRGDKSSWASLTRAYAENAKQMDFSAQQKDRQGTQAAHKKLMDSCTACHKVHRKD